MKEYFNDCLEKLRVIFVCNEVFNLRITPIERIVYGAVGLIIIAVFTALIYSVIRK